MKPGAAQRHAQRALRGFEHINRYWDHTSEMIAAKILPGEFYVTVHDELITTVLGSCVSACICDPDAGVGGMNHFMLPLDNGSGGSWSSLDRPTVSTRFGNHAMEQMINEILKNGGRRERLEVKIFGGGRILAQMTDIGRNNVHFVQEYLNTEGLRLLAQDVGDVYPRKVQYFPLTGKARVKKLRSLHNDTIIQRETAYLHHIEEQPVQGAVELF